MIYNGQLDVIIAFPQTENFLNALDWTGKYVYAMTPRTIWKVQGEVAGYVRTHHIFSRILNFLYQYLVHVIEQPNFRIPNPKYFCLLA